MLQCNI